MSPIYIPPTPIPIIRQKIRNQADIQEQLRAYDRAQQDLVGANAAAFDKTNLDKRVLYPLKLSREETFDMPELEEPPQQVIELGDVSTLAGIGEEESKLAESTATLPPSAPRIAPVSAATEIFGAEEPPERPLRPVARGRPRADVKTIDELKAEIRATGYVGYSNKNKKELQAIAKQLGINLMR